MKIRSFQSLLLALILSAAANLLLVAQESTKTAPTSLTLPSETHLKNVRQLTFGGQNAEAYFSIDDKTLIFQHQGDGVPCDQIYTMPVDTADGKPASPKLVSGGVGRTTCSYIFPSGNTILYSSTRADGAECPPKPDYSQGYVWPIYSSYDIYTANLDGSNPQQLTKTDRKSVV